MSGLGRLFGRGEWGVVLWSGEVPKDERERSFRAMAVRHLPQRNAATVLINLSEDKARREAERLNTLNSELVRCVQRAPYEEDSQS